MTTTISPLTSPRKRRASSPSVPRATSSWSLVSSRQTAAGRSGASAASAAQRGGQPPRRLEGDDGLGRLQHPLELAGAARQEPLEAPAVGGQPRGDQRRRDRRRPGQHLDLDAALDAGPDQPVARVGEDRRAGVGEQRDPGAALDRLGELRRRGSASLPSWLETKRGRVEVEPLVEAAGAAGVLAGDEVGVGERLADPRGEVADVADRRSGRRSAGPPSGGRLRLRRAPRSADGSRRRSCPASGPSSAASTGVSFMRRQRAALGTPRAPGRAGARPRRSRRRR